MARIFVVVLVVFLLLSQTVTAQIPTPTATAEVKFYLGPVGVTDPPPTADEYVFLGCFGVLALLGAFLVLCSLSKLFCKRLK